MRVFPSLVWAVRDFALELKRGDKLITSDEYLEGALKLKQGRSPRIEQYNMPRRCLRSFFAVRKCFVFTHPASVQNIRRLEQLTEKELDSEFLDQANKFCQYIYDNADPKTVFGGHTITGTALGNLAEVYVEAIRSGKVPCLENAVESLAKIQNVRAVDEALQLYMTEMFSMAQLPMRPEKLSNIHKIAEKKAIEVFITMSFNDSDMIYQKKLMGKIHDEYQDMCQKNHETSCMRCEEVLHEVFDTMEKSISDGSYLKRGGYRQYRDTLTQLTSDYRAKTHSQIMSEDVLSKYLRGSKEEIGNMILQADQSLNATEREKEVQRLKNEILEQRQRGLVEQNRLQEQAFKDMQRSHDEHVNQIIRQMKREQERIRRDNERVLEAKLKEREALLQQSFQQEADRMQREIDSLKADMHKQEVSQPSTMSKILDGIGTDAHFLLPGFVPKLAGVGLSLLSKPVWTKSAQSDESQFLLQHSEEEGSDSVSYSSLKPQSSAHSSTEDAEMFTAELVQRGDEDKHNNTYRFVCPHAGQFQCSLTSLVFVMEGEGEVLYNIVSWDPGLLDGLGQMQPVGPLYNIDCSAGSVSRLHLPHCVIFSEESKDGLAVAHFTGGNVEIIQPLKVTETHVMTDIRDLSRFGLIWIKTIFGFPISGQVLFFLRPVTVEQKILNVHLLPGNVPISEVQHWHQDKKYIETSSKCRLFPNREYSLCCQPEDCEVQPMSEMFELDNFGPNYHPMFEVFLDVNIEEVRLGVLDKTEDGKEVWNRRRIPLTAPSKVVEPPAHRRIPETEFVNTHGDKLIQRVSSVMAIADSLKSKNTISREMWSKIHAAETRQQKMRLLWDALDSGGDDAKVEFFKLLKEKEPNLVDELGPHL